MKNKEKKEKPNYDFDVQKLYLEMFVLWVSKINSVVLVKEQMWTWYVKVQHYCFLIIRDLMLKMNFIAKKTTHLKLKALSMRFLRMKKKEDIMNYFDFVFHFYFNSCVIIACILILM